MTNLTETTMNHPLRLAVLISGGGTTLDNFVNHIEQGKLSAEISLVIASREDCAGIEKSRSYGFPTEVVARNQYENVESFSDVLFEHCREHRIDLVILGGFLSLLKIPEDFRGRIMNIHPSLIPAFCGEGYYGGRVHLAVFDRGVKTTGCTVHFADNKYDHGPIILQRTVPVLGSDTPKSIARKVFLEECIAYPEAVQLYAQGKVSIREGRVWIAVEDEAD
ncbi:MAG: phosphoribosylglycinamide formyltransferase [Planctomycetaceae bacterium]|nr:phosphoribosylglycinamide formyltransferase [Planctomycetaceae bacterium]